MSGPPGRVALAWVLGGLAPDAPFEGPTCALELSRAPLVPPRESRNAGSPAPGGGTEKKLALESAFILNEKKKNPEEISAGV